MPNVIKTKFLRKEQIAASTWKFIFEKKSLVHIPGQFTTLFLGHDSRDFTITSSPLDKEFFIVTKEGKSDFKKKLFSLKKNTFVSFTMPSGGFTIQQDTRQRIFLAGGIGMNPFYSMISYAHGKKAKIPMHLFVSFAKKEDMIFYDKLQQISQENPFIKITYSLTQEKWNGETGRISEKHIKKYVQDFSNAEFLIAGPEQMVYNTENILLHMGIGPEQIRIDIFTGY